MQNFSQQLVQGHLNLLSLCPQEVAHLRKELLIAAKHILATDLRNSKLLSVFVCLQITLRLTVFRDNYLLVCILSTGRAVAVTLVSASASKWPSLPLLVVKVHISWTHVKIWLIIIRLLYE